MKTKLICLLIALSSATTMWAERIWFGNLCYETTSDSTVCVTYQRRLYYGTENNYNKLTSVTIPSSIHDSGYENTYRVTGIGEYTFDGCTGLTSITIPDGITYIGQDAFRGCTGLTSITMPNSVTSGAKDVLDGTQWYKNNQMDWCILTMYYTNTKVPCPIIRMSSSKKERQLFIVMLSLTVPVLLLFLFLIASQALESMCLVVAEVLPLLSSKAGTQYMTARTIVTPL